MKNLFYKSLFIPIFFISFTIFSQIPSKTFTYIGALSPPNTVVNYNNLTIVGSSYIDENYSDAKLSDSDKIYAIRYNTYLEEMEVEKDGQPNFLPKKLNYTVTFEDSKKTYQVYTFDKNGQKEQGYFVILVEGNRYTLLLKENINFTEEVKPLTGYDKYKPPTLKRAKDKVYIGYVNNTAVELPNKNKDVLTLFSNKSKDVESYAKKNKLGYSDTDDLVQIFEYYNSLK